jgi:hypothetical protein
MPFNAPDFVAAWCKYIEDQGLIPFNFPQVHENHVVIGIGDNQTRYIRRCVSHEEIADAGEQKFIETCTAGAKADLLKMEAEAQANRYEIETTAPPDDEADAPWTAHVKDNSDITAEGENHGWAVKNCRAKLAEHLAESIVIGKATVPTTK